MPWFKVDDAFHSHPKTMTAGTAAIGLWVRCGSWSSQQLTDGFVPTNVVLMYGTRSQAKALVAAGLWDDADGGYQFHDWDHRNPLREHIESVREEKRKAGQAGGRASGKTRAKFKQDDSESEAECLPPADGLVSKQTNTRPVPVPSRPVPPTTESPSSAVKGRDPSQADLSELQQQAIHGLAAGINQMRPGIDKPSIEAQLTRMAHSDRSWPRIAIAMIACALDPETRFAARVHMTDGYWHRDNDSRTQQAITRWVQAGHPNPMQALVR